MSNYEEYLKALATRYGSEGLAAQEQLEKLRDAEIKKYNEDQDRDERGRFAGSGTSASAMSGRAGNITSAATDRSQSHGAMEAAHAALASDHEDKADQLRNEAQNLRNEYDTPTSRANAKLAEQAADAHQRAANAHWDASEAHDIAASSRSAMGDEQARASSARAEAMSAKALDASTAYSDHQNNYGYKSIDSEVTKYNEDQERDDHGRFAGGSGGSSDARASVQRASAATSHVEAAYAHGMAAKMHEELAKAAPTPEARALHEDAAVAHLQAASAHEDAEYAKAHNASDASEYSSDARDMTAEAERASSYAFDGTPRKSSTPEIAKKTDYENMISERKGDPANEGLYDAVIREAKKKFDVYPSAVANAWVVQEYKKRGGTYGPAK